ncbi:AAA family ATPase [Corynebacterium halotolerans]|uniref:AAA family ATPase n=1 Tax=Corynebacterium halotolerans TaxID=225326 RepID=UPI003CFA1EB2
MRIHDITIENFKAITRLELKELPGTGVIVIAGDNEQGKSTIMEAIDTVLTAKHRSKAAPVKAIQPVGQDVPSTVSLKVTVGEVTLRVTKQYNRKASATLDVLAPRTENYTGDQAEDRLAEILAQNVDEQLLSTLFMRQGEVDAGIQAVGIPSLSQALDGQTDSSGVEDTGLTEAARSEYRRYYTKGGREAGELKKIRGEVEAAEQELTEASTEVEQLAGYVDNVSRLSAERERAEQSLPQARADLAEKEEARSEAEQVKSRLDAVTEELVRATEDLARATAEQDRREVLRGELEALREALDTQAASRSSVQEKAEQEAEQLEQLGTALDEARQNEDTAAAALRSARQDHRLVVDAARRAELSELLDKVTEVDTKIAAVGEAPEITGKQLAQVEEAATELSVQQRLRESLAAKLTLRADSAETVTLDGEDLEVGQTPEIIELTQGTSLRIGAVTAEYSPGEQHGADTVEEAERRLSGLLRELDCPDIDEVRRRHEQARRANAATESLERERAALLSGQDPVLLRRELETLQQTEPAEIPEIGVALAEDTVAELEQALTDAQEEVKLAESRIEPWREKKHSHELTVLEARLEAAQSAVDRKASELKNAEEAQSAELLAQAVTEAESTRTAVAARREEAEEALRAVDLELAVQLAAGAKTRVSGLEETISRAKEDLARLTGYIEQATGAAERLDRAESEFTAVQARLASVERRAAAAEVLCEVLDRHRDRARSRYARPFAEQLTALARTVFGSDVAFSLDDQLQVEARSIGERSVPLESLSGGAREQLAILTRFAIARLVAEGATSVPVFVDDALGSTDPERLDRMAALFSQAGRTSQVFVLTCVPQRYESVTGKLEYRIEDLKALSAG